MATTIKMPPELKARIAAVVEGTGQSAHAFMLEALEEKTRQAERRRSFIAEALQARDEMDRTGLGYDANEVHEYVRALAAGQKAVRPKARSWRK